MARRNSVREFVKKRSSRRDDNVSSEKVNYLISILNPNKVITREGLKLELCNGEKIEVPPGRYFG